MQFLRAGHFKDPTYVSFDPFEAAAQLTKSRHSIQWKEWMDGRKRMGDAGPREARHQHEGQQVWVEPCLGLV